jgi:hypothetical protein
MHPKPIAKIFTPVLSSSRGDIFSNKINNSFLKALLFSFNFLEKMFMQSNPDGKFQFINLARY